MTGTGIKTDPYKVESWEDFCDIRDGFYYAISAKLKMPTPGWNPVTTPDPDQSIQNLFVVVRESDTEPEENSDTPFINPKTSKPSFYLTDDEEFPCILCWGEFPSEEYRTAAAAYSRETAISGSVKTVGGTTQLFCDDDIKLGSLEVFSELAASDYYLPGAAPSAEARVNLNTLISDEDLYGAELRMSYWLNTELGWYEVPLGIYHVYSVERDSQYGVSVIGYDSMKRFDDMPIADVGLFKFLSYRPVFLIRFACRAANIDVGQTALDTVEYVNQQEGFFAGEADSSIETARDLIMSVTQILNTFAYIDRWGNLQLRALRWEEPKYLIPERLRKSSTFSQLPYRLQELRLEVTSYDAGDSQIYPIRYETLWGKGVKVNLEENALWITINYPLKESAIRRCVTRIADQLSEFQYYPLNVTAFGDPAIELGDWVRYSGALDVKAPVCSSAFVYHSEHRLGSYGREAVATVARSQADKRANANKANILGATDNVMRETYLRLIQSSYSGMSGFQHKQLAYYTYEEIGKETNE